jgi:hypothetical protein
MTVRQSLAALAALISLTFLPDRAHAIGWMPDIVGGVGVATAIQGGEGDNGTAFSASASAMWPFQEPYRFGIYVFTDDLGESLGRLYNEQGQDLGPAAGVHRKATGFGWRAEAHRAMGSHYDLFGLGTWAYYRIEDDLRGDMFRRTNTPGLGVGIGASRVISGSQWLGMTLTYRQLWRGLTQRYLTVAAEWRWHTHSAD